MVDLGFEARLKMAENKKRWFVPLELVLGVDWEAYKPKCLTKGWSLQVFESFLPHLSSILSIDKDWEIWLCLDLFLARELLGGSKIWRKKQGSTCAWLCFAPNIWGILFTKSLQKKKHQNSQFSKFSLLSNKNMVNEVHLPQQQLPNPIRDKRRCLDLQWR